ncbi:MAG: glycoside hydrolase family 31 [Phycisphaerales bacterium]|nr:glycoside hydrolase family 31 [Phycisphaerales bacterium]MCB9857714.1 glycoside hydrolase family 31 [Phycisphaerales bacterium]
MLFSLVSLRNTTKLRTRIHGAACLSLAAMLTWTGFLGCSQQHHVKGDRSLKTLPEQDAALFIVDASQQLVYCEFGRPEDFGVGLDRTDNTMARPGTLRFSPMIADPKDICEQEIREKHGFPEDNTCATFSDAFGILVHRIADANQVEMTLATINPQRLDDGRVRLTFTSNVIENFYGLGEQFDKPGEVNGDLGGRMRTPGCEFGNMLVQFHGGYVGNAQFPILYCVGDDNANFAIFVDDTAPQTWDFTKADAANANGGRTWTLTVPKRSEPLRWFVIGGDDLPSLREQYMELVGRPPVPPKKMFGFWLSEYGFNDWAELDDKLRTLRENRFPIDGFVLDLQWFGDIQDDYKGKQMGSLTWDEDKFPEPAKKMAKLRDDEGVGIMVIEESYVDHRLPEYETLASKGYLVRDESGEKPARIDSWWGDGGMIDWTNKAGADFWHDWKREPLVEAGVMGHWTDLGEPEAYRKDFWYMNTAVDGSHKHADAHNLFNFRWAESIARGYKRNGHEQPPFIMSRSGTSGIQRFGASMWSGDIGSNLPSLAAHLNVQMHVSMSGIDYFGSDVGGFRRDSLMGDDESEMYTRWFAHSCLLDVPLRPHTSNTENKYQTAPDRVGDLKSNLFNLRRRYALTPYLHSLACMASVEGAPVFPPLVYYYQNDDRVREIADQKMIGRDLMMATDVKAGERRQSVYLPAGDWYDFETGKLYAGDKGRDVAIDPTRPDGIFTLPLFARAGAIIPMMHVDDKTMNVLGKRTDGSRRDEIVVRIFAGEERTSFGCFEDTEPTANSQHDATNIIGIEQECLSGDDGIEALGFDPTRRVQVVRISSSWHAEPSTGNRNFVVRISLTHPLAAHPRVVQGRGHTELNNEHLPAIKSNSFEFMEQLKPGVLDPDQAGWRMIGPGTIELVSGDVPASDVVLFAIELEEPVGREADDSKAGVTIMR